MRNHTHATSIRKPLLFAALLLALAGGASLLAYAGDVKTESILFGGRTRTYALYVPAGLDGLHKAPLVIVLHGGAGDAERMRHLTKDAFEKLADRDGFVVVYPEGIGNSWNDGREAEVIPAQRATPNEGRLAVALNQRLTVSKVEPAPPPGPVDDVGFISELIDRLVATQNIDPKRVFATGISNGAMMVNRLGCELSEKIGAIAPVAGQLPQNLESTCHPAKTVSVLTINGTDDPLVPFSGGEIRLGRLGRSRGTVLSTNETMKLWAKADGCAEAPEMVRDPAIAPADGTTVRREFFQGCREGAEVMLYAVEGGGHAWPGGVQYLPVALIGRSSRQLDAAETIWNFFRRHRRY
jgi:polyhydroxybutyrate depolymerase